jgi:hypothetical protein
VPPVSLRADGGIEIGPETFLDLLAPAFDARERQMTTCGFEPIRRAWLAQAARLGEDDHRAPAAGGDRTARSATWMARAIWSWKRRLGAAIAAAEIFF